MNYSNLRHRIIFLKPCGNTINGMNENVTHWISFKPTNKSVDESDVYLSEDDKGNPILTYDSGGFVQPYNGITKICRVGKCCTANRSRV